MAALRRNYASWLWSFFHRFLSMSLIVAAKATENCAVTFRKSETVINCFRPQLILVQRIRLCICVQTTRELDANELVCASFRENDGAITALHPGFLHFCQVQNRTAKRSGVVSSVAHEVNQPLMRWKCNFFHFQEEKRGRDHFNNFLRLLCYNIRDLFLLCYSFPS